MENENYPVLYILARTDIASMNPGKLAAQCSHASTIIYQAMINGDVDEDVLTEWTTYKGINLGFGTTIVLDGGTIDMIETTLEEVKDECEYSGIVHDPTYPLADGDFVHHIHLTTVGFAFGYKEDLGYILGDYSLYP